MRREAWPLRPDLAPFLLLVKLRCFLSLAELCFRWGQPTGEHLHKSVVEVFVNGRQCVAARVYPGRADSLGVSLRAQGATRC